MKQTDAKPKRAAFLLAEFPNFVTGASGFSRCGSSRPAKPAIQVGNARPEASGDFDSSPASTTARVLREAFPRTVLIAEPAKLAVSPLDAGNRNAASAPR